MNLTRTFSTRLHVLRLALISAGFLVILLTSRSPMFTLGSSIGWAIIILGNFATMGGEQLRRPVKAP
jgi:hypothetical protein